MKFASDLLSLTSSKIRSFHTNILKLEFSRLFSGVNLQSSLNKLSLETSIRKAFEWRNILIHMMSAKQPPIEFLDMRQQQRRLGDGVENQFRSLSRYVALKFRQMTSRCRRSLRSLSWANVIYDYQSLNVKERGWAHLTSFFNTFIVWTKHFSPFKLSLVSI